MGGLRSKGKRLEGHVMAKVTNLIAPDLVGSYVTSAGTACSLQCCRYLAHRPQLRRWLFFLPPSPLLSNFLAKPGRMPMSHAIGSCD